MHSLINIHYLILYHIVTPTTSTSVLTISTNEKTPTWSCWYTLPILIYIVPEIMPVGVQCLRLREWVCCIPEGRADTGWWAVVLISLKEPYLRKPFIPVLYILWAEIITCNESFSFPVRGKTKLVVMKAKLCWPTPAAVLVHY